MKNRRVLFWVLFIGLLIVDQAVKAWARHAGADVDGRTFNSLWPGVFELTLVYNRGIAFGQLQGYGVLLAPIALAIAGGSIWYSLKHPTAPKVNHVIAALFASGALGNLYDRLMLGKVTDMFDFKLIHFPVFNVADACITVSGILMVFVWIKDAIAERRETTTPTSPEAGL